MELREGAIIADRYRLMRLLGKGGMGEVWAAQHTSLDIPCAVKFIHADASAKPEVRARFEREAKAAAQLRTPNVVQILDYGIFENTPYIAMEYLEGEPLNARLSRRPRLDGPETLHVVTGIARALQKAHIAGIVHRDLKPENVFLVQDIGGEIPKVLDFGVAKQADTLDSNTKTGALLGTPYYMSPEQAQGIKSVDHRADLWSLAVLTFRCLTGELPFKSTALGDLLIKIVTHPIPMPSHVAPDLPRGFDAWWARAAQRDPDRRFQSAIEMAEGLALALGLGAHGQSMARASYADIPMQGGTVVPPPAHAQPAVPFAQSGASQMPSTVAGQPTPMPFHPGGSHPQLGGEHQAASMAGVTATTAAQNGASKRVAFVFVALAVVGLGAVAAFVAVRGTENSLSPAASAPEEPAKVDEPSEVPSDQPSEEPTEEASVAPPEAEEGAGGGPAGDAPEADAKDAAPPITARPPRPRTPPPPPDPPPPPPKPKGFDPGF